jgi:hypothetical protein
MVIIRMLAISCIKSSKMPYKKLLHLSLWSSVLERGKQLLSVNFLIEYLSTSLSWDVCDLRNSHMLHSAAVLSVTINRTMPSPRVQHKLQLNGSATTHASSVYRRSSSTGSSLMFSDEAAGPVCFLHKKQCTCGSISLDGDLISRVNSLSWWISGYSLFYH